MTFSNGARSTSMRTYAKVLKSHRGYHSAKSKGYDFSGYIGKDVSFGNAVFVREGISVLKHEELAGIISEAGYDSTRSAIGKTEFVTIQAGAEPLTICNLHGLFAKDTNKKDIPERIEQSHNVKNALDAFPGEKILCGDFNLVPDGKNRIWKQACTT